MKTALRLLASLIAIAALVGAAGWVWLGTGPEIAAVEPVDPASLAPDVVTLGARTGGCGGLRGLPYRTGG